MRNTRPYRISCRVHPRTRVLAVVALALVGAGIWNMDGTLGAMGVAGGFFCAAAWGCGRANLKHLAVLIDAPHRATSGIAYPINLTVVKRRGWLDTRSLSGVALFPGNASTTFELRWIAVGTGMDFPGHATPGLRAVGSEVEVALRSDFPLGLFEFGFALRVPHEMCVVPRARTPRESPGDGVMFDASPLAGATQGWFDGELRGLRGWRGGDRPGQIAWPASLRAIARGIGPVVRETDPPGFLPDHCVLVFHSFSSGGALIHPEKFDRALEVATGWMEQLGHLGIRTRFIADFDAWKSQPANTRDEIIILREKFARAKRRISTEAHELQHAVTHIADQGEAVILVSDMPREAWEHDVPALATRPVISSIHAR